MRFIFLICCIFVVCSTASAGVIQFPNDADPSAKYIFYSHGYIVEGDNPKPIHPRWGEYDYPSILEALSNFDALVISEHRKAQTSPVKHAKKLEKQVNELIKMGVPPSNITLIGFSRGGYITALASNSIKNAEVNYVILAACTSSLGKNENVVLTGHIFSIHERSDSVGSCADVIKRNPKAVSSFEEIEIDTGLEHGAFYRPIPEWLKPIKMWIKTQ